MPTITTEELNALSAKKRTISTEDLDKLANTPLADPDVYDGLTPDETYKKAGEVWDAAIDSGISLDRVANKLPEVKEFNKRKESWKTPSTYVPGFGFSRPPVTGYDIGADAWRSIREIPANLKIGIVGLAASAMENIKRRMIQLSSAYGTIFPDDMLLHQFAVIPTREPGEPTDVDAITMAAPLLERQFPIERERLPFEFETKGPLGPRIPGAVAAEAAGVITRAPDALSILLRNKQAQTVETLPDTEFSKQPITVMSRKVVQSGIPSMGVAVAVTLATGSPTLGLLTLAETEGGSAFQTQLAGGGSILKAGVIGELSGAAEAAGESLVFPKVFKGLVRGVTFTQFFTLVAENATQEGITGLTQRFLEVVGLLTTEGVSYKEAAKVGVIEGLKVVPENMLVGGATVGVASSTGVIAQSTIRAMKRKAGSVRHSTPIAEILRERADKMIEQDLAAEAAEIAKKAPTSPAKAVTKAEPTTETVTVFRSLTGKEGVAGEGRFLVTRDKSIVDVLGGSVIEAEVPISKLESGPEELAFYDGDVPADKVGSIEAFVNEADLKAAQKPAEGKVSIERGISAKRATELTGQAEPTAFAIRQAFNKMTPNEQAIVIDNTQAELVELKDEKKSLLQQRKDAFVPDKPIYTTQIKTITKSIESKERALAKLKLAPAPKAEGKKVKLPETASGGVPLEKPAGLSKAEREHLGPREARALIGGQKLGEKIGFKEGERRAALEGKRRLDRLRVKVKMTGKNVDDVYEVIKAYVPGEEQKRFINRLKELGKVKERGTKPLSEKVDTLTSEIHNYIADYEKRAAVRRAKKFAKDAHKEFDVGEEEFKALPPPVRDALRKWAKTYDLAKLSDAKRAELEAHNEHIISVAGSIASAFERFEQIDVSEGEDIIRLSDRRIDALRRIEQTPINDLSTEQINRVIDELESLIAVNKQKQSSRGRKQFENIQKRIIDSRNTVYDRGERKGGAIREHGKIAELSDLYQDSLRTLLGKLAVKDADKLTDTIWEPIARSARAEADVKKQLWVTAEKMIKGLGLTKNHIKQLNKSVDITLGGKEITVPQWVLLHLYLDTHADGNFHRLLTTKDHYINTKDKLGRVRRFKIGKITLDEIRNIEVPDWMQKLAEVMFKHNKQVAKPLLNETSMSERFYELATAENYFPYPRYWDKPLEGKRTLVTQPIENIGRFQPRTGGTRTHNFFDPIETFYRGIGQNAAYIARAEVMQEIRSILANKALRTKINETGNKKILDAIENILRHVDGLISDQELAAQLGGKWLSNFSKATLAVAPATGVIQVASEPAFFEVIERRFFRNTYIPNKADAEQAMEEDPVLWWRWKARQFDYVTGSVSAQKAFEKMVTGKEGINNKLLDMLTWGDQKTVMRAHQAAKDQITYYNPNMIPGSTEHKQAALELFHRGMETQPQWGAAYRSGMTLSKNLGVRPFALFMSARNAQFNLFSRDIDNLHKGRIGVKEFSARLGNVAECATRVAMIRHLVRKAIGYGIWPALLVLGLRDTDDLKEKVKDDFTFDLSDAGDFVGDVAENVASIAFLGGVVSHMIREAVDAMGGKSDWARMQSVRTGNPIADAVVALGVITGDLGLLAYQVKTGEVYGSGHPKVGQPKWHDTAWDLTDKIGLIVSQSMGLPWSGPRRDIVWPMQRSARKVVSKTTQEMQTFTSERAYQHRQRQARIIRLLDIGAIDEAIDAMVEVKDFSVLKQIPNRIAKKIAPNLYRWSTWNDQDKSAWIKLKGDKFDKFVDEIVEPLKELNDKTIMDDPLIKNLIEWSKQ